MKKYTTEILKNSGYEIENAKITSVSLNMKNYGCLTLDIILEGYGWGVCYGGYCLGKGYVGADDNFFEGSDSGLEAIMRIMDVVGVDDLIELKGKYVRVAKGQWGDPVKILGNITEDKWFDYESFFADKKGEKNG